jgi:hypothetical protein
VWAAEDSALIGQWRVTGRSFVLLPRKNGLKFGWEVMSVVMGVERKHPVSGGKE